MKSSGNLNQHEEYFELSINGHGHIKQEVYEDFMDYSDYDLINNNFIKLEVKKEIADFSTNDISSILIKEEKIDKKEFENNSVSSYDQIAQDNIVNADRIEESHQIDDQLVSSQGGNVSPTTNKLNIILSEQSQQSTKTNTLPEALKVNKVLLKQKSPSPSRSTVFEDMKPMSKLRKLVSANNLSERFEESVWNSIEKRFEVQLFIGTESYLGSGSSEKCAKLDAAFQAITESRYQEIDARMKNILCTQKRRYEALGATYYRELHVLATIKGLRLNFKFLEPYRYELKKTRQKKVRRVTGNFRVQLNVGKHEFYAAATSPLQAKHTAAMQALVALRKQYSVDVKLKTVSKGITFCKSNDDTEGKSMVNSIKEDHIKPTWTQVCISGPDHMKLFTWRIRYGKFSACGTGPSNELAQDLAAQKLTASLPNEMKFEYLNSYLLWRSKARK